jgi:hypothetical protein
MTTEKKLAKRFHALVREALPAATLEEVDRLNRTWRYRQSGSCATHDYSDANEFMAQAFREVKGYDIVDRGYADADCELWGRAWDITQKNGFNKEWSDDNQ